MIHLRFLSTVCFSPYRHMLSAALDNELGTDDRVAVKIHIEKCVHCRTKTERLRFARNVLHNLEVPVTYSTYPGIEQLLIREGRLEKTFDNEESAFLPSNQRYRFRRFAVATVTAVFIVFVAASVYFRYARREQVAPPIVESHNATSESNNTKNPESASIPKIGGNANSSRKHLLPTTVRSRDRGEFRASIVPPQQIELPDSSVPTDVRGSDNSNPNNRPHFTITRSPFKATPLTIDLPENSKKGEYLVTIRTVAKLEPIKQRSNESDGRRVFIKLPLQGIQSGKYMLLVERKDFSGDEYIGEYPVVVVDPAPHIQDGMK